MNELNTKNWKEFRLDEVFERIEPSKGETTLDLVEGNEIPYVGAKKTNGGIVKYVAREGNEKYISEGNCIVFILLGDGSGGYSTYQENEFIGMNGKTSCGYNKNLNKDNALFIITVLDKARYKYCFGRAWTGERFSKSTVLLPQDNKGKPDWEWMSNFISSRRKAKYSKIKTKNNATKQLPQKQSDFLITDYFEVKGFGSISNTDIENYGPGEFPYVTRTAKNNGISGLYDYKTTPNNTLTIETTLSGLCFYHDYEYSTGDHMMVLKPREGVKLNKYTAMYIKTVWRKNSYKYSYGRPAIKENIVKTYLRLPEKNGQPDWETMEEYIKSLPYADQI